MRESTQALSQRQFDALKSTSSLTPNEVYFVDGVGYRATSSSQAVQVSSGGSAFVKNTTTGMFETTVGSEKALAFPSGPGGEARGVYVGRADTLAGLYALAANEGELSVATDGAYIVKHGVTAAANVVFGNEIAVNVGDINYGNEASGIGWVLGDGGVPTFLIPTGIRRIVLFSTRGGGGVHPDITTATAFILRPTLADLTQCPEISVAIAAKLDVGGCEALVYGNGVISRSDVSSTAYWPPVVKFVAAPGLDLNGTVKILYPTAVTAVSQSDAHALIS